MKMRLVYPSCLHSLFLSIVVILIPTIVVHSVTLDTDIQVLHLLKRSIDPNTIPASSFLNSWDFTSDPCDSTGAQFLGILCADYEDNKNSRVTTIELDNMGYDGFLTSAIGNLTELTTLSLGRNSFRGPIPDTISNLRKLRTFSVSGNFFTGNIPTGLLRLRELKLLDLSHNNLSGSIPAKLSGLRSLLRLSLSYNEFSGHITSLGKLQHLRSLDLSFNRFTGPISQEVITLPELVRLNVSFNRFNILEVIRFEGRPTQLQQFDAHANQLGGRLPVNLVTISNLTYIDLSHNQFYGPIPRVYGERLGNYWRSLFLDHNFLSGDIPREFDERPIGMTGSLANNCLRCPSNLPLCHGAQRPASECVRAGQDNDSD